ncbi:MAG: PEFG-CTERM sorting domain-containing protein [Thermoproteota archaeon]|jgi:predicted secreted protein with PEFG-CTERM motif|nr:PEFG-CTERM sorting domain-containing protein [Thermoproteota archaeon]
MKENGLKTYTLTSILLASLTLVVPIGTTYAQTEDAATTNTTGAATTEESQAPAVNATGGGEWTTFELTAEGQTLPIEYIITGGSVENMTIHGENQTLGVTINSMSNGTLSLRLPREVIDSKTAEGEDADFAAFIDDAEYEEPGEVDEPTEDTRTILIGFPAGAGSIDVIGTSVIPEFSTIAVAVLAVAIIGIIIATARNGRFNFGQSM